MRMNTESAACAPFLFPPRSIIMKVTRGSYHQNNCRKHTRLIIFPPKTRTHVSAAYLWITILRQDLQHRRFSALYVSHEHQFAPHHQRLIVPSLLHGVGDGPVFCCRKCCLKKKKKKDSSFNTTQKSWQWDRAVPGGSLKDARS